MITRRYEFYKYIGPIDAESGEAMADEVAPDGVHEVGTVTYNDHFDPATGEFVEKTVDLSTLVVVGDFIGAQMSGFDIAPALGLIDHIPDGDFGVAYADRRVVIAGGAAFLATTSGPLPSGTTLDGVTGIFSGIPTVAGEFTFTVDASDFSGASVSKKYTVTIAGGAPASFTITTSASPVAGGSTSGDGKFDSGTQVSVVATHGANYAFVNWTEDGTVVNASASYTFTASASRTLVANFVAVTPANDPPVCSLAQPTLATLWPANHKLISVGIVNVSDPNTDQVTIRITGVTQDEPVNGLGDGDNSPDAVLQGDKVLLRSERGGNGDGRVYRVNFTAIDGQGGECTGFVNVSVPKSMQPGNRAVDDGQRYDSTLP